jgi:hypothetical protein
MALLKRRLLGLSWDPVSQEPEWKFEDFYEDVVDGVPHLGFQVSTRSFKYPIADKANYRPLEDKDPYATIQRQWVVDAAIATIAEQMNLILKFAKSIPSECFITDEGG